MKAIDELVSSIGISEFELQRLILRTEEFYRTFTLPGPAGRARRIVAPTHELKAVQRWIVREILRKAELHPACTACRHSKSTVDVTSAHFEKDFVYHSDIKDFFRSITGRRVEGLFKSLNFPEPVAKALSRLCTFKDVLPGGAPGSPYIANLICRRLDRRLHGYCVARKWTYTRYCDAITISGSGTMSVKAQQQVTGIVQEEGFTVNRNKTRVAERNNQKQATSLAGNESPTVPRTLHQRLRINMHQVVRTPVRYRPVRALLRVQTAFVRMVHKSMSGVTRHQQVLRNLK